MARRGFDRAADGGITTGHVLQECRELRGQAVLVGARSVALPAVSAGAYGWDPAEVAHIAVAAVRGSPHLGELDLVRFVLFSPATHEEFVAALR